MLRAGDLPHETQQLAAETIERSIRTQAKLIDDIFDVSRIVTGKLDLKHVIAAAVETMQPGVQAKSLRLEIESENAEEVLLGDHARLQQVIWNLLSNAVKFTVAAESEGEGHGARFTIRLPRAEASRRVHDVAVGCEVTGFRGRNSETS